MKTFSLSIALLALSTGAGFSQKLVYLGCDVSSPEGKPSRHFDFTLDEANGTVSYYVASADAMNKDKAVFGAKMVTWTLPMSSGLVTVVRTIDRVSLVYTEVVTVGSSRQEEKGVCTVVKAPERKF